VRAGASGLHRKVVRPPPRRRPSVGSSNHRPTGWALVGVAPFLTSLLIFVRDYRHGYGHHPAELLAAVTLWGYLFGQGVVYVTSFLDEFVFDRESVYVTTTRADTPVDD